jgi:hypothetical protein
MSDDPRPGAGTPVIPSDREGRLVRSQELTGEASEALRERQTHGDDPPSVQSAEASTTSTYTYGVDGPPPAPPVRFEHDPAGRVFRLTAADGTVEVFRDNPTRYLCVEPDRETGEMRPVMKHGRPVYLHLCREEREVR